MTVPSDLSTQAEALLTEQRRQTPIWRKLEMVGEMNEMLERMALGDLRRRFPNDPEPMLRRRLAERRLGPDLAARVCGPKESICPSRCGAGILHRGECP